MKPDSLVSSEASQRSKADPGPEFHADGKVTFRVWAPRLSSLAIQLFDDRTGQAFAMARDAEGVFTVTLEASSGTRYWIVLPDGTLRPDPASRFQPNGVHGPSQLVDTTQFVWASQSWRGVPKRSLIL